MHTDVKWMRKQIEGNGVPGLIELVKANTAYINQSIGRDKLKDGLVGSGWAVTVGIVILQAFGIL